MCIDILTGRGGGCAIVVANDCFTCKEFKTKIPEQLEICWASITHLSDPSLRILVGAFYSSGTPDHRPPPGLLQSHCIDVADQFTAKFPDGKVIVGGDINNDTLTDFLSIPVAGHPTSQRFFSLVDKPTRMGNILDVIVSDMTAASECEIYPPLAPDLAGNPREKRKASDHNIAIINLELPPQKTKPWIKKTKRQYSPEALENFVSDFTSIDWSKLAECPSVDAQVEEFQAKTDRLLNTHFPYKSIKVKANEAVYFSQNLKNLHKKMRRMYKNGNNLKFRAAKKKFQYKLKEERAEFFNKKFDESKRNDSKKWHADIKELMANGAKTTLTSMPDLQEMDGLSDQERAEHAVDAVENITKGYAILDVAAAQARHQGGGG